MANKLRASGQIQDKDRYIRISEAKEQMVAMLDKIRAEIVELTKCPYGTECLGANCPSNTDCMICGDHVLEIIDKYKEESEVKNEHPGNCMICGREIKIVTKRGNNKFPNIFFCPGCEKRRLKKGNLQTESEE